MQRPLIRSAPSRRNAGDLLASTAQSRAELMSSATFAMSLGAKELFHTNFLAFLLESQDEGLESLQRQLREALGFPVASGESTACAVWRERKNLDLVVVPLLKEGEEGEQDGVRPEISRFLVVEAKLKSLPTRQQLDDYMNKHLSLSYPTADSEKIQFYVKDFAVHRVLLTPEHVPLTPDYVPVHEEWKPVSWHEISTVFKRWVPTLTGGSKLQSIFEDYAVALEHVLSIVQATRRRVEELLAAGKYSALYAEVTHAELRRLRLHDLAGKVAFDEWVRTLHGEVKTNLEAAGIPVASDSLTSYVHFSNSEPGLGLETTFGKLSVGVQVQGMQLRRYVSTKTAQADFEKEVLDNERLLNEWLRGTLCGRQLTGVKERQVEPGIRERRGGRGTEPALSNLRAFNAKKFLYSAINLQDLTMAEVHQAVLDSIVHAMTLSQ